MIESGWLIEMGEPCAPDYVAITGGRFAFTPDPVQALRFAREEDAAAMLELMGTHKANLQPVGHGSVVRLAFRVSEHQWGPNVDPKARQGR